MPAWHWQDLFFWYSGITVWALIFALWMSIVLFGRGRTLRRMWRARKPPPPPPWPDLPIPPEGVIELMFQARLGEKIIDGEHRAIWLTKNYKRKSDIMRLLGDPQPIGIFIKKLANNWPTLSAEADEYRGPFPNGRPEDQDA